MTTTTATHLVHHLTAGTGPDDTRTWDLIDWAHGHVQYDRYGGGRDCWSTQPVEDVEAAIDLLDRAGLLVSRDGWVIEIRETTWAQERAIDDIVRRPGLSDLDAARTLLGWAAR